MMNRPQKTEKQVKSEVLDAEALAEVKGGDGTNPQIHIDPPPVDPIPFPRQHGVDL